MRHHEVRCTSLRSVSSRSTLMLLQLQLPLLLPLHVVENLISQHPSVQVLHAPY